MFIAIRDGKEESMAHFEGENRAKWGTKWADLLKNEALPHRNEEEIKVKTKGYSIDESYEEYVIAPKEW